MIKDFADKRTEGIWRGEMQRRLPPEIQHIARRKLRILNNVQNVEELRVPPGNRLEALRGDRRGQHSIRINDQWRICFIFRQGDVYAVEITDYH